MRFTPVHRLALATMLCFGFAWPAGAGEGLYDADPGPLKIEVKTMLVLRNDTGDELQLRVTWPREKPGAARGYPLIVWSHGATGSKDMYQPLVRHWVSHGYVCIQANHPDSRVFGQRDEMRKFAGWDQRPGQVAQILDSLDAIERQIPALRGKIDRTSIGVGGHSFGAHTAQLVGGTTMLDPRTGRRQSYADPRPKAFVLISPQGRGGQMDEKSWDAFTRPMIVITGSRDLGRDGQHVSWRLDPFRFAASREKYLLYIEGAQHDFGGIAGAARYRNAGDANADHLAYVKSTSLAFWDAYLKSGDDARAYLQRDDLARATGGEARVERSPGDNAGAAREPAREPRPSREAGRTPSEQVRASTAPPVAGSNSGRTSADPAGGVTAPQRPASAVDRTASLEPAMADLDWFDADRDRTVPVRIYAPAEGEGSMPLIVFSHGGGESRDAFTWLGERWARAGYAVVFVTHIGSDRATVDQLGMRALAAEGTADQRTGDLRFAIDRATSDDPGTPLLAGRIDATRIAAAGQCAGSTTALALAGLTLEDRSGRRQAFADDRVRAVIALSPQVPMPRARIGFHDASWSTVEMPALVVTGTRDFAWIDAVRKNPRTLQLAYDGMPAGSKFLVEIQGARHHAFTDNTPWYPAGPRDPRHHGWIADATTRFLDGYLRNDSSARQWLTEKSLARASGGAVRQEAKLSADETSEPRSSTAGETPASPTGAAATADETPNPGGKVVRIEKLELPANREERPLSLCITMPAAPGSYPLIVFSHYVGGSRLDYEPLARHWSAGGFVVVQADHSDSRERGDHTGRLDWRGRTTDMVRIIDSIEQINRALPPGVRIDPKRVGVGGHLIGAYAACMLGGQTHFAGDRPISLRDERTRAVLLLSPQGIGQALREESWREIDGPMLVVNGSKIDSRRTGNNAQWRTDPYRHSPAGGKYLLWLDGMDASYAGLIRSKSVAAASSLPARSDHAAQILDATVMFWRLHLAGDPTARPRLQAIVESR
ncbi:MAG: alpha/beta hydrolase family protein [Phycisphaeraceae bacterium]